MTDRINIKNLSPPQLAEAMAELGEQRHRTRQIMQWIWQKGAASFDEMTSLSLDLRSRLNERFRIPALRVAGSVSSDSDGSHISFCTTSGSTQGIFLGYSSDNILICIF